MLKQFVPNEFCLKCDVCCRFPEKNSCYAPVFIPDGHISLKKYNEIYCCPHFLPQSNSCGIYNNRPLDCQLYPLMVTYDKEYENVILCVDTKCPYVQKTGIPADLNVETQNFASLPHNFVIPYQPDAVKITTIKNLGGLKALSLEHKNMFESYTNNSEYSARSFVNIYIWSGLFNILWKIIDENLCVFYEYENDFSMMFPPLSENIKPSKKAIEESINMLGAGGRIENISEQETLALKECGANIYKNTDEYIYLAEELAGLEGNKFESQRAAVNRFTKNYKHIYRPFDINDTEGCLDLYAAWQSERKRKNPDKVYQQLLEDSFWAHENAMLNYKELGFIGRVVEINKKICAYTFAFRLNKETYCAALEIADLNIKGLAQFIYKRLCEDLRDAKYINAMDDSGLETLRQVKLSYHPCKILSNYIGVVKED